MVQVGIKDADDGCTEGFNEASCKECMDIGSSLVTNTELIV
jgi:hypothetical protein